MSGDHQLKFWKDGTKSLSQIHIPIFCIGVVLSTIAFGVAIFTTIRAQNLQKDFDLLKADFEIFRSIITDNGLVEDIKNFENYDDEDNGEVNNFEPVSSPVFQTDADDIEYVFYYQDGENDDPSNESSSFDRKNLTGLLFGGDRLKIGRDNEEKRRKRRDTTYSNSQFKDNNNKPGQLSEQVETIEENDSSPNLLQTTFESAPLHYASNEQTQPSSPSKVALRKARVLHHPKKVYTTPEIKLSYNNGDSQERTTSPSLKVIRDERGHHNVYNRNRPRQRTNSEIREERKSPRMQSLSAIQFSGDTSKYVVGIHEHYNGDGHIGIINGSYSDWKMDNWVRTLGMDQHFTVLNENLKIKENGLYFIYAQIFYNDEHDLNGYRVYKNDRKGVKDILLLQCTTMTVTEHRMLKSNTCYTAGVDYLTEGDEIFLKDISKGRYTLFEPGKSFFGLLKLADVRARQ